MHQYGVFCFYGNITIITFTSRYFKERLVVKLELSDGKIGDTPYHGLVYYQPGSEDEVLLSIARI